MSEPRRLTHLVGALDRQWTSMNQLVADGIFPSSESARKFCLKYQGELVIGRKGRLLLVDRRSLDRFFEARASA